MDLTERVLINTLVHIRPWVVLIEHVLILVHIHFLQELVWTYYNRLSLEMRLLPRNNATTGTFDKLIQINLLCIAVAWSVAHLSKFLECISLYTDSFLLSFPNEYSFFVGLIQHNYSNGVSYSSCRRLTGHMGVLGSAYKEFKPCPKWLFHCHKGLRL